MSVEDEVLSIRRKLEKMTGEGADQSQALDLLKSLGSMKINLSILTSTRYCHKQDFRLCVTCDNVPCSGLG